MDYKYKKGQIFGKRIKTPQFIKRRVYNCTLSLEEYIKYELDDKIPISCIIESDRRIAKKFGIDKCKELDWELINKNNQIYYDYDANFKDLLMSIDSQVEDINYALYELVKDKIKPSNYSSRMKEAYQDRLFEISQESDYNLKHMKRQFNEGKVSLEDLVCNWDLFKDKDLSYCLLNDEANKNHIIDRELKEFMTDYGILVPLLINNNDIYTYINEITTLTNEKEKREYTKLFTDNILSNTHRKNSDHRPPIKLTDDEYKEIFKYSSMEDYLKTLTDEYYADRIMEELRTLPTNYLFTMPFSLSQFFDSRVLKFAGACGLKNIIDFDNECEHFFTKNDNKMLKKMSSYIYHRGSSTKDEFYEVMRKIATQHSWEHNAILDYRNMTGEFKRRYPELFISQQAPEELQDLFYTKQITPGLLVEHPEYIEYLNGKDLDSCFKERVVKVEKNNEYSYESLYTFLGTKTNFNGVMNFITEYSDILDIVFDESMAYSYKIEFSNVDNVSQIQKKINEVFKKNIIKRRLPYPKNIPQNLIENYPTMFLNSDAPEALKEAFYNRTINSEFILSNESYKKYLKGIDLEVIYKYMPVKIIDENHKYYGYVNLVSAIKQAFGEEEAFNVMLLYGKYIDSCFKVNLLLNFELNKNFSKNDLLDELDKGILQTIIDGKIKYDENMSSHFKNNNPTLFLDQSVPQEIRNKFYNRELTLKDFDVNPELIEIFGSTNIACGFSENMSWMISLFSDSDNLKIANYNRLKVISAYSKIQDTALQNAFKEYVMDFGNSIDIEKIEYVSEVLSRLSLSNSSEIFTFRKELASQILKSSNPLESLSKIEDVFIRNNIPTVGKIYSCFEILHPNFQGFNFDSSMVSPVLKKSSTMSKKIIVFSDLIKASFGSNNRSVNVYLKNIEIGSSLYESIKSGQIYYDKLSTVEQNELLDFSRHLTTLYNNTMKGKRKSELFTTTGDVLNDIFELSKKLSPDGTLDYNLQDRIIRMFCGFAGIDTLEQAKEYIEKKIKTADLRNRNASSSDMVLEKGDFIKGIGGITYLRNILQNGSVSKEFLGSNAGSDATPLDTDISMILDSEGTIAQKIDGTAAKDYGPIWFVLKNDDRFITTRNSSETFATKRDMSKMEVFYTGFLGEGHYGIRTGFASSEINYIVMDNYDPRVGLEIAMNSFYIPVVDKKGKIVFTPKDYDELRTKMNGLSYFGEDKYTFSENLITEETVDFAQQIEQSNFEVQAKREKINSVIKISLEELGLYLKTNIDGDLTEGFVELIDTGSTGRGTNKPGDGDFDFMMRLDRTIMSDSYKLSRLRQTILKNLGKENTSELTGTGDFRLKNVQIDDEINVDIDITFSEKTDKVSYSTDMALQDRLATIQRTNSEKYKYVVANILLAKQFLKEIGVYKPNRGEIPQGGLGGVGIENWILQNSGSFIDAARSFVQTSEGKSFSEFQSSYQIWDFGDNHLAERRGQYPHDNFVSSNMSEAGYQTMKKALSIYIKKYEENIDNSVSETINELKSKSLLTGRKK